MKGLILFCFCSLAGMVCGFAQDSLNSQKYLPDITVVGRYSQSDIQQMPEVVGTSIYAGKKSSLVVMEHVKGNVVNNNMRQVLAKVPGIHIWESDGSGIQIGIASRGLSPNRSWEFNVRQNGYDISADPYGYPEAYYNPQLQAVQRIEVIRGHGALQYGPQFGGMVNYILKNGNEINSGLETEAQQTIGSNGLFNVFAGVGGKQKKIHFYAFADHRQAKGFRMNSRYATNAGFATITYQPVKHLSLTAELMRSHIRSQQPGGLTDAQLKQDKRQSQRARNWMDIGWTTMAFTAKWNINPSSTLQLKIFGVMGDRSSVGFMPAGGIVVPDTILATTMSHAPRNLNTDQYRNWGSEARLLREYNFWGKHHTFSTGLRWFRGNTFRYAADGKGSTGMGYDMRLSDGIWTRDLAFQSTNGAAFAENIFRVTDKLLLIPGFRYEYLNGNVSGRNGFVGSTPVLLQEQSKTRGFIMAGAGAEYHLGKRTEIYANISQAYRPVQFADLSAPPTTDVIDQDLKDARGHNADIGFRGKLDDWLFFDISAFILQYNNRIGTLIQQRLDGSFYNFRTNVGNSFARGLESFMEYNPTKQWFGNSGVELSAFLSYAYNDARYSSFKVVVKGDQNKLVETNLRNRKVENAPAHIVRTGITTGYRKCTLTFQYSFVGKAFSDANNTLQPGANANSGLIPAYAVMDLTAACRINHRFLLKSGINNLTNASYFTRRAGGYPGPGAMPADGRTFFLTLTSKFK